MKVNLIIVLAFLIAGFAYWWWKTPKFSAEELAPDFTATQLDGAAFSLSDLKGKYVLLDFWGSWCPPCRAENPALVKLYNKYSTAQFKDAEAFTIVSLAVETSEISWKKAIERDGLTWEHHISSMERFADPVAKLYGVREIPTKYFIGPAGNIISVNADVGEIDAYLEARSLPLND